MLPPYKINKKRFLFYEFVTDKGIRYEIFFLNYGKYFKDEIFSGFRIYNFYVQPVNGSVGKSAYDERIEIAINEILSLFFKENSNVAIYYCDYLDGRQRARKRKFDRWFKKSNQNAVCKEDFSVKVNEIDVFYSVLILKDHPSKKIIFEYFRKLNGNAE